MKDPDRKVPCRNCGTPYLLSEYSLTDEGTPKRLCDICLAKKAEEKKAASVRPWNWACAVNKFIGMSCGRRKDAVTTLTPEKLQTIMELQHGHCVLTSKQFYLPQDAEVPSRTTLPAWVRKLPEDQAALTPVLVRVDSALDWVAGNVFFIINRWAPIYNECASLSEFRKLLNTTSNATFEVPTHQQIIELETKHAVGGTTPA